jgi:hypothetical protein
MASGAGLTRTEARWAIAQSGVAEMHHVLAYTEAFAVIAAGVTVEVEPPERLVRRMITATLRGDLQWTPRAHTFPVHLCKATRLEVAGRLALHARLRGCGPALWEARLGPMQVGDLRGIEQLAHWAGEMMVHVRSNDGATLEAAVKLADFVRARLQPWAGEPDDEDTARLPARTAPAPAETVDEN